VHFRVYLQREWSNTWIAELCMDYIGVTEMLMHGLHWCHRDVDASVKVSTSVRVSVTQSLVICLILEFYIIKCF
jgi:hypothetical protein